MTEQPQFSRGANMLTNTLHGMIKGISSQPPCIDIGIINSDYSLTTNSFPKPIPKTEYSVCRSLLYDPSVPLTVTYVDGAHSHSCCDGGPHMHKVRLPKKMYWVRPGQKVLVAIIQNEFVVIDIIYDGKHLGESEPNWT